MKHLVRRLPMWAIQVWMAGSVAVVLAAAAGATWAGMALHRENDALAVEVERSQRAIERLATVNEAQDGVLTKANKKLRRLGENPVSSPFPFIFTFDVIGATFTVTCAEPGKKCLVQSS